MGLYKEIERKSKEENPLSMEGCHKEKKRNKI
jgi:hypothetical protein